MEPLTKKQKQVYDFINSYTSENGISPTIEEIRKEFNLKAISTVHEHVETLKKKGYLFKNANSVRGIITQKKIRTIIDLPVIGTIAAGKPIEATEEEMQESITISNPSIKNSIDYYALKVVGNSMIEEGIFDGDIVIIKKQAVAENGQTVVAIIDDNQATLKKLYQEKNRFRLEPRNSSMLPFFRKDVEVRGVVVQIISNISNNPINESYKKTKHKFRTIDLFAGVGGIRLGFEKAGFNTVFANDFDISCKITYDQNFSRTKLIIEDIKKIGTEDLPEFDFLLAGFPCQPFSIAGYRQGFKDEKGRGNLFFNIARIIDAKKPEGFLLENVKNLKSHDGGKTFTIIEKTLQSLGYHLKIRVLNSMDYGNIPQNRERLYIVGFKNKNYIDKFSFPEPIKLTVKISDLLQKIVPTKYYYNNKPLYEKLKNFVKEEGKVYQWRRQYVRENKSGVCPTLTANMGMGGHNVPIIKDEKGIRKLTPLECFKIQGFPKDFLLPKELSDSALYKQAGNSVSVPVIESIAKKIMEAILG